MKVNKFTLPNISPNSQRSETSAKKKQKVFKSWIMNDTFSNWKKKPNKRSSPHKTNTSQNIQQLQNLQQSQLIAEISIRSNGDFKNMANTGITLGQYFRTRSNTQNSITEQIEPQDDQILPYLRENFQIHQSDQDHYQDSENSLHISNKQILIPKQQLHSDKSIMSKIKTEKTQEDEGKQKMFAPNINVHKKKPTLTQESKEKIVGVHHLQESFDLKKEKRSKNRSMSNEVTKKVGLRKNSRKNAVLEKVKADKMRASEMKNSNVELFTKYAQKFHLNDKSCQEYMRNYD